MAKKKEEITNEPIEKIDEAQPKSQPKSNKKKPTPQPKPQEANKLGEVKTLLDWIDGLEDSSFIFEKIMKHGYYQQYKTERELRKRDKFIPPSVYESEFKKIMED